MANLEPQKETIERSNKSCSLTDLAEMCDVDVKTFQSWITLEMKHEMLDLGWTTFTRKLPPTIVGYLRDKLVKRLKL